MKYFFSILFSLTITIGFCQIPKYENIVFEGGGIMGLAYSGVLKQLEEHNMVKDFKKVGGTSAGAITATMLSLGYNSTEVYNIIANTKFQNS